MLQGVSLFLVGMMGSGKSTVGRLLAARLGYAFLDTDDLIEKIGGVSIEQFFTERGESAFRELETQVLASVSAHTRVVVATGGGAVIAQRNWGYLRHGVVLWLDAELETLARRLERSPSTRPLLAQSDLRARLEQLSNERRSLYAQADVHVRRTVHLSRWPRRRCAV